ncbi:MAG: hypothetical protein L0H79_21360 [Intrasporangium sp.]|uniref:hypothetical protein n=1 Tax=Intrasporangium sp. TaxID=1925024 RepID=UPI0026497547|nr:hypothetical protein [Intrasporangium sp.]MDN5798276.1 hypothetical protein [Intrasporangium sp.]
MLTPRHAITAGLALVVLAVVLMTGGHGFWIIFPVLWFAGHGRCGRSRRYDRYAGPRSDRHEPAPSNEPAAPDPTHDRHEAFPGSR